MKLKINLAESAEASVNVHAVGHQVGQHLKSGADKVGGAVKKAGRAIGDAHKRRTDKQMADLKADVNAGRTKSIAKMTTKIAELRTKLGTAKDAKARTKITEKITHLTKKIAEMRKLMVSKKYL